MECQSFIFASVKCAWLFRSGQQQWSWNDFTRKFNYLIITFVGFCNWNHVKRMDSVMFLWVIVLSCAQYDYCVKIGAYATHAHRSFFIGLLLMMQKRSKWWRQHSAAHGHRRHLWRRKLSFFSNTYRYTEPSIKIRQKQQKKTSAFRHDCTHHFFLFFTDQLQIFKLMFIFAFI